MFCSRARRGKEDDGRSDAEVHSAPNVALRRSLQHCRARSCRHHFRDAVQAVVGIKVRLRDARRHIHTVHLCRDTEHIGTCGDQVLEGGYEEVETRALEVMPVSPSVTEAS